jgi:ribonuclease HI
MSDKFFQWPALQNESCQHSANASAALNAVEPTNDKLVNRKLISALYCDGGVIASNPSEIGGTYAFCIVFEDGSSIQKSFAISKADMGGPVTNNQTEMLALLEGLKDLPDDFAGTIYSDSQITLGRVFLGWKRKNIPGFMHKMFQEQRARLTCWNEIKHVLLAGHPTKAQLQAGIGKHGYPVSEYNVWCDEACQRIGQVFLDTIGTNIPVEGGIMTRKALEKFNPAKLRNGHSAVFEVRNPKTGYGEHHYFYRDRDGELFTTVAHRRDECDAARKEWQKLKRAKPTQLKQKSLLPAWFLESGCTSARTRI